MPTFRGSRWAPRPAADMFDLVADFERYPEFLPFCRSARIVERAYDAPGLETLMAEMEVGFGAIRERFATRDVLDRRGGTIRIAYSSGPFRRFESTWTFRDHARGGCRVAFSTDYELRNVALGALLGRMFDEVFRRLAEAFIERAETMSRLSKLAAGRREK